MHYESSLREIIEMHCPFFFPFFMKKNAECETKLRGEFFFVTQEK